MLGTGVAFSFLEYFAFLYYMYSLWSGCSAPSEEESSAIQSNLRVRRDSLLQVLAETVCLLFCFQMSVQYFFRISFVPSFFFFSGVYFVDDFIL